PGQPALRGPDAAAGRRRVGARVLPQVPEPPPRLPRRVLERRELEQGRRAVRLGVINIRTPKLPSGRGVAMSPMTETRRRRARRLFAVAAACAALPTAPALAAPDQLSLIEDEPLMLSADAGTQAAALDEAKALGADVVRANIIWAGYAPAAGSTKKPKGFDAKNTASYPGLAPVDAFVN